MRNKSIAILLNALFTRIAINKNDNIYNIYKKVDKILTDK